MASQRSSSREQEGSSESSIGEEVKGSEEEVKRSEEDVVDLKVSGDGKIVSPESRRRKAIKAKNENNLSLSMSIHDNEGIAKEKHKKGADFLKSIIYGGLDGIMTCFAVVTGATGADLGDQVILILGIAALISNAIAMGIADFISDKAENDYALAEKKREEWEYKNYPKGEIDEMIQLYEDKGMQLEDAQELVKELSKYKEIFIDTMMVEEVGVMPPDPSANPAKNGCVTALSFIVCGIFPLFPFIVGVGIKSDFWHLFIASCVLTGVVMFVLGAVTSIFTILSWWKGGLYMLVVGAVGAAASFLIGWGINIAIGPENATVTTICNCNSTFT